MGERKNHKFFSLIFTKLGCASVLILLLLLFFAYKENTFPGMFRALKNDPDDNVRKECAEQIALVVVEENLPMLSALLLKILKDKKENVSLRDQVARTIGRLHIRTKETYILLQEISKNPEEDSYLRDQCCTVLSILGKPEMIIEQKK